MGDVRDPETDQPAPKPGGVPVQAVLIEALKQRMAFGLKKYGRLLETHNGRDPLRDMWEEMLDMVSYFTQYVLEQGVELPGLEQFIVRPEPEGAATQRGPRFDLIILDEMPRPAIEPGGFIGEVQTPNPGCACQGEDQSS